MLKLYSSTFLLVTLLTAGSSSASAGDSFKYEAVTSEISGVDVKIVEAHGIPVACTASVTNGRFLIATMYLNGDIAFTINTAATGPSLPDGESKLDVTYSGKTEPTATDTIAKMATFVLKKPSLSRLVKDSVLVNGRSVDPISMNKVLTAGSRCINVDVKSAIKH